MGGINQVWILQHGHGSWIPVDPPSERIFLVGIRHTQWHLENIFLLKLEIDNVMLGGAVIEP